MAKGFTGKILKVDLTYRNIHEEKVNEKAILHG